MFSCKGGKCLLARAVCDGTNDCSNEDDENNCSKSDILNKLITNIVGFLNFSKRDDSKKNSYLGFTLPF